MRSIFIFLILGVISACNNKSIKGTKKINLNDASAVITETDTAYLGNIVADISPNQSNTKKEIATVIAKVDSAKEATEIASTQTSSLDGTQIKFNDFAVSFSTKLAINSDRYTIADLNAMDNAQIVVNDIKDIKIEQRFFTKLGATIGTNNIVLNDLQEYANPWQALVMNNNQSVVNNSSTAIFKTVNNKSIILAADRELRKLNKTRKELEEAQLSLSKTNGYKDAPCKVIITAIHYKISGTKNGKTYTETVKVVKQ
jgi:hypothetical protein